MNVSACLVTRGEVDMQLVLDSLPAEWEKVVWDNGAGSIWSHRPGRAGTHIELLATHQTDLSVYGRYAAIEYASHDLIYVQDDDVIVSDSQAIMDAWLTENDDYLIFNSLEAHTDRIVANMPSESRVVGWTLAALGSCFHRDLPGRAFHKYHQGYEGDLFNDPVFQRNCDIVFTTLTPHVLVEVPVELVEIPQGWDKPERYAERKRMFELANKVKGES